MNLVLDTDITIYFLKGHEAVVNQMAKTKPEFIHSSIITHSELLFGAYHSKMISKNLKRVTELFKILPTLQYDEEASAIFAQQKSQLKKRGQLIPDMDLMIASICIANDMTLVTNNSKHFIRINDLDVVRWV